MAGDAKEWITDRTRLYSVNIYPRFVASINQS
jgi:hypothetical protein